MKTRKLLFLSLCLGFVLILLFVQQAQAALGESSASISSDRKALVSVRHATTARNGYTVQEIDTGTTVVREYISPSGIVFGIAWNGLTHPDLTLLLGSYNSEYQKALTETRRMPGRRHVQIKTDGIVVEKWGHMRNLRGRAYTPALIPEGVSVDEIK